MDGKHVFRTVDIDGDVLTVTPYGSTGYAFTVSGEDGHRMVYLAADQVAALVTVLGGAR